MIAEAIEQAVEEDTNLDWKQALPHKEEKYEFAKDTAAMANSGGGVIVYGIKEVAGPSTAAGSVSGVSGWGDSAARRLRQIAYSAIQPPVHGLTFEVAERDGATVVAMAVPSSPESPHLVWQRDAFVAPVRYGAQTEFMREQELERAYRRRFTARDDFDTRVQRRTTQVVDGLDTAQHVWMVGTAVPTSPRPTHLPRVSRDAAQQAVMKYMRGTPFSTSESGTGRLNVNPRAGHRRWRFEDRVKTQTHKVIEVHDDGGVTFAQAIVAGASSEFLPFELHPKQVQDFIANFVWLSVVTARSLQVDNSYSLRITIETDSGPVYIRQFDDYGFLVDASQGTPIHKFIPIEVSLEPSQTNESLLRIVRDVATDVVNQAGHSDIGTAYLRPAPMVDAEPLSIG